MNFRKRVVVADDNRTNQKVLGLFLEKGGFEAVVVGSGDAVLDKLWLREPVHAVVLDVSMPGLTGIEVIKLIRFAEAESRPEERLPIIAVTADERLQTRRDCLDAGANAFLVQPVSPASLVATVRGLVSAQSAARRERPRIVPLTTVSDSDAELPGEIVDRAVLDQLYAVGGAPYLAEVAQAVRTDFRAIAGPMRAAIEDADVAAFRQQAFNLASATGNLGCARIRMIFDRTLACGPGELQASGPRIQAMLRAEVDLLCDSLQTYRPAEPAALPVIPPVIGPYVVPPRDAPPGAGPRTGALPEAGWRGQARGGVTARPGSGTTEPVNERDGETESRP